MFSLLVGVSITWNLFNSLVLLGYSDTKNIIKLEPEFYNPHCTITFKSIAINMCLYRKNIFLLISIQKIDVKGA